VRYFGGVNVEETAEVLGITPVPVKRDWEKAKAWLYGALSEPSIALAGHGRHFGLRW
jgi:RNA polymerase sigma-70 factor (ECF subfamily)